MKPGLVVDADWHILEPGDLWEEYLEPPSTGTKPSASRRTGRDWSTWR